MGLTLDQKRAQIERIIAYNIDEGWDEKTRARFFAGIDFARGTAFHTKLPATLEYDLYRKSVESVIRRINGTVKYDPQTLYEMQRQVLGHQRKGAQHIREKIEEVRKRLKPKMLTNVAL